MAGELKLKQEEIIRKDNTIIYIYYGASWANFNQYKLTPDLIEKLDSEEIYIEDINLTELELIDSAGISNANSEGAIFELKEVYFPDLISRVDVTELFSKKVEPSIQSFEFPNSFDRVNKIKDIISHKEAEYTLSILNDVKEIISEILYKTGADFLFISDAKLKGTSLIDDKIKLIKVNVGNTITFNHIYLGNFNVNLEELSLQSLIELSQVI
jgi:hypothetical protein